MQVTEQTGFKVPAQTPEQAIQDMSAAMQKLAHSHELRVEMGKAGRQLVNENFSWTVVGERLDALYQTTTAAPIVA